MKPLEFAEGVKVEYDHGAVPAQDTRAVDRAITSRRSIRAFLPTPVPRETITEILEVASRSPSGSNIQPWKVTVVSGASRDELCKRVLAAHEAAPRNGKYEREFEYYPREWSSPYIERRRTLGFEMYRLAGIPKGDKDRMHAQHGRNYELFDAPVGLFITLDRILELGSYIDCGTFIQSIMVAARARGLDTCPQAAWGDYYKTVLDFIQAPSSDVLMCGIALGYADPEAAINGLVSERERVPGFTTFLE